MFFKKKKISSEQFHSVGGRAVHFRLCGRRIGKRSEQKVHGRKRFHTSYSLLLLKCTSSVVCVTRSVSRQVHIRGDGVLLEMVAGPIRGYAERRERPRGVRTVGVHRRRLEYLLLLFYSYKMNSETVRVRAREGVSSLLYTFIMYFGICHEMIVSERFVRTRFTVGNYLSDAYAFAQCNVGSVNAFQTLFYGIRFFFTQV